MRIETTTTKALLNVSESPEMFEIGLRVLLRLENATQTTSLCVYSLHNPGPTINSLQSLLLPTGPLASV